MKRPFTSSLLAGAAKRVLELESEHERLWAVARRLYEIVENENRHARPLSKRDRWLSELRAEFPGLETPEVRADRERWESA